MIQHMDDLETAWLAGFLEGEGYFAINYQPNAKNPRLLYERIAITSTDRDVLEHVKELIGSGGIVGPLRVRKSTHTPTHQYMATGSFARNAMMKILPLMHKRRADRIRRVLAEVDAHRAARERHKHADGE
jgi:hypothetical protein